MEHRIADEFKKFISRGNVIDLAVGFILGAAFTQIVTSIVKDVITPIIGIFVGGINVSGLAFKIGEAHITYGAFLQASINFLIIALVLFLLVKAMNKLHLAAEATPPKVSDEVKLLTEIRDILKAK